MNKITALFSLLITSYIQVYSQEFSKVYTAQTPIEPLDLAALNDGNSVFLTKNIICKIDNNGDPIWTKKIEGTSIDLRKIIELDEGSFIVAGEEKNNTSTIIFKINSSGSIVWQKAIKGNFVDQTTFGLIKTSDNQIIVGIQTHYGLTITKLDSFGNFIWKSDMFSGENSGNLYDDQLYFNGITETSSGEIILSGLIYIENSSQSKNGLILSLNSTGQLMWCKKVGNFYISGVKEIGAFYYFRCFNGNTELLVTDLNGNVQMAKNSGVSFAYTYHYRDISLLENNSLLIHGQKSNVQDYLFEYSLTGEIINTYEFNGELLKVCQFPNGEIIMLTNSNYKLMISKINSLNSENACITSNDIATSSDVTLSSVNYQILEITNSEYSNTSIQAIDASITVTNGCEILSVPQKSITTFSLHPNPANDFLQLTTENPTGEYQLLDAQGRLILKEKIISSTQQIDLKGIQSGIYFVEIDGNVKRFIKE